MLPCSGSGQVIPAGLVTGGSGCACIPGRYCPASVDVQLGRKSKHFQVYRDNSESHVGLLTLSDYHRWSHAGETLTQHVVCELDVRNTTPEPVRILDGTREPTSTKHGEAPNLPNLHAAEEDWQDLGPCNLLESYRSLMPAIWSSSC